MRRSVFAQPDGIVGVDEDDRQLHHRRQTNRRPHVVGEDEERRAVRAQTRQRHAVDDRAHGVLANAEVEVAAAVIALLEVAAILDQRLG